MWSVILNLEDTASSEYVAIAESGEDFLESDFVHGGEFNILSVDPLVRCRECKNRKTPDCPMCEIIKQVKYEDGWMQTTHSRKIDYATDDDYCSRGVRKDDADLR